MVSGSSIFVFVGKERKSDQIFIINVEELPGVVFLYQIILDGTFHWPRRSDDTSIKLHHQHDASATVCDDFDCSPSVRDCDTAILRQICIFKGNYGQSLSLS